MWMLCLCSTISLPSTKTMQCNVLHCAGKFRLHVNVHEKCDHNEAGREAMWDALHAAEEAGASNEWAEADTTAEAGAGGAQLADGPCVCSSARRLFAWPDPAPMLQPSLLTLNDAKAVLQHWDAGLTAYHSYLGSVEQEPTAHPAGQEEEDFSKFQPLLACEAFIKAALQSTRVAGAAASMQGSGAADATQPDESGAPNGELAEQNMHSYIQDSWPVLAGAVQSMERSISCRLCSLA